MDSLNLMLLCCGAGAGIRNYGSGSGSQFNYFASGSGTLKKIFEYLMESTQATSALKTLQR
jgi:hypothetical protein